MKHNPPMLVIGNPPKRRGGLVHFAKGSPEAREHMARLRAMRGTKRASRSVPEQHQIEIAAKTLQMPDPMIGVMGGPSRAEAQEILRRFRTNPLTHEESIHAQKAALKNMRVSKRYERAGFPMHAIHHMSLAQGKADVAGLTSGTLEDRAKADDIADSAYGRTGDLMRRETMLRSRNPRPADELVCSYCGGMDFTYMGQLGPNQAYRCRRCGMDKVVRGRNPMPPSQDPYARMWAVDVRFPKEFKKMMPRLHDRHFVLARTKQEAAAIVTQTLMHDYGTGRVTRVALEGSGEKRWQNASDSRVKRFAKKAIGVARWGVAGSLRTMSRAVESEEQAARRHMAMHGAYTMNPRLLPMGMFSMRPRRRSKRMPNPYHGIPPHIANDPQFRAELAAYRKRHGNGPVRITQIKTPAGFPKFVSAYGKAPEIKYDAPAHSNKGKRIHKFGESGGRPPWLVTSCARGPKFLAFVGGTFRAKDWLYR